MAFFKCLWIMMTRVKAPQLPPLAPKTSSASANTDTRKKDGTCLTNFALFCTAVSFGVTVLLTHIQDTFIISLVISGLCALFSGLCLAEFLANHAQNGYSVYSSAYHSICELVAYVIGWTWILSIGSCFAAICMTLSSRVDDLAGKQFTEFFKSNLSSNCPDILSAMVIATVVIIHVTGISYKNVWLLASMPLSLACGAAGYILSYVTGLQGKSKWTEMVSTKDGGKVLAGAALCSLAFMGSNSALRVPRFKFNRKLRALLGPLNIVCMVAIAAIGLPMVIEFSVHLNLPPVSVSGSDVVFQCIHRSLVVAALCFLALEYYHQLLIVVQDISSDGLMFRCLSKQWEPFCNRVVVFRTSILVALLIILISMVLPVSQILLIASVGLLFINLIVSLTVLLQRYSYRDSWCYEPMLPNGTSSRLPSHQKATEFAPRNNADSPSQAESNQSPTSDSDDSSETDIDAVVQEYKEKIRLSKSTSLNSSTNASIKEPTSSTSFRSKMFISCHTVNCIILGITLTIAIRTDTVFDFILSSAVIFTMTLSFFLLCFLHRLPQNKTSLSSSRKYPMSAPLMPWCGGLAVLLNCGLLVHVLVETWHVVLPWTAIGIILYFAYGIRNSTAASPFHSLPVPALAMQPFPKEKASCRVLYQQNKPKNKYKLVQPL